MMFTWNMTEKQWKDYVYDHKCKGERNRTLSDSADCYGNCMIGKLCIDFCHTLDDSAWYPYSSLFCLDIDDGYGYTEDGRPYSLLDNDIKVPINCKTFDSFKREFEKRFAEEIIKSNLTDKANQPLGWKE